MIKALRKGTERRYDIRLVFIGHFGAGKTTLINRLRHIRFNMKKTTSTNCIVVITKGGIRMEDGQWIDMGNIAKEDIYKRMKNAKKGSEKIEEQDEAAFSDSRDISDNVLQVIGEMQKVQPDRQPVCRISIWDFAGQSVFNSVHQMFMSYRAIYVIVFDISKPLNSEIKDDDVFCLGFTKPMNVEDFCLFLLQSVHMYHGQEKDMFPKVLLVGTHKDKVNENTAKQRMVALKQEISNYPDLQNHVVGDVIVDNSVPDDPAFENIRRIIFRTAKGEKTWGEITPASWMPLEKDIIERRDTGTRILTFKELKDINTKCFLSLESDNAIYAFLRFQNALGNMMFFGKNDPDDLVILEPQWLIDSVKQIITHEQFYTRPAGLDKPWEEFRQCAKLDIDLIEAIWSQNADKTFIQNKRKVLEILESTDIFCSPKVYNKDGHSEKVNFVFVPSMLKPNDYGLRLIKKTIEICKWKSPTLCFVFKENFMPPAIFPRIQAACTKEYSLQRIAGKRSLFYQSAIFRLDSNHELILEQFKHLIRVNIVSFTKTNVTSDVCEATSTFLEDTLKSITNLYHTTNTEDQSEEKKNLPYSKAIQCPRAEGKDDALYSLHVRRPVGETICRKHELKHWHPLNVLELIAVWQKAEMLSVNEEQLPPLSVSKTGNVTSDKLIPRELGRIARLIPHEDLRLAVFTVHSLPDIENLTIEHRESVIDLKFNLLWKWSNKQNGISLEDVRNALVYVDHCYSEQDFQRGIQDKDYAEYMQGIPTSFLDRPLDDATIDQISQRTGKAYQQLAIELGVNPSIIETVVIENPNVIDRTRKLIRHWKLCSTKATFREVAKAIIQVNMDISIIEDCYIESETRITNLQI